MKAFADSIHAAVQLQRARAGLLGTATWHRVSSPATSARDGGIAVICTRIRSLAGRSKDDLAILAVRGPYEEVVLRDGSESTESWILRVREGGLSCVYRTSDLLADLCLDPAGVIWAATYQHLVRIEAGSDPEYVALECSPTCIASTQDGRVFCGGAVLGANNRIWEIADGRAVALPELPEEIEALHALGTTLFAAGNGFCSRWDGQAWRSLGEIDDTLHRLHAVDDDHVYAAARDTERGYRYRDGEWTVVAEDHPVQDIAQWGGSVWIAAGDEGLLCDGERVFDVVDHAHTVLGATELVFAGHDMVCATTDGQLDETVAWCSDIDALPEDELPEPTFVE
jgi:hypothetical protein